jgi:hypothetical protein
MVVRGSACDAASCTSRSRTSASKLAVMNACLSPGEEQRPFGALAGRQVDRPGGARRERDGHHLAALARDHQGPVPALQSQVLDIGAGGLRDPQPDEREQRDEGVLGGRAVLGGGQEGTELVAVQGGGTRLVVQPRSADVRGGRVVDQLFLDGVPVEPGDGGQPPGHGRAGTPERFQFPGERLDVGPADGEQRQ